ncbi:MAG: SUMF1/EgtB/PvdO family nonheme iron enzyme [Marinifilaceae bacterium]
MRILLFILTSILLSPSVFAQVKGMERIDMYHRLRWVNVEALELALNDLKGNNKFNYAKAHKDFTYIKNNLERVRKQLYTADSVAVYPDAINILDKQRSILMANPALDMDKIVVTRFGLGKAARIAMANKMCMPFANYVGLMDTPATGYDAELCELSNLRAPKANRRTIYKPTMGEGIADVQMHWDADRLIFASAQHKVLDAFNNNQDYPLWRIFEVNMDGSDLKVISDFNEPDLEFADPCYLPDGRILFTTNIGYNGIPCEHGERIIMNLALYDPKTKNMRKITFDQDGNWSPTVLSNGRIMYTRWEYTDLTHYFSRIVMHSNPDGTECKALYGSGSFWPTSVYDMQQIPGSNNQFVGIVSGHHGTPRSGRLVVFDPAKSRKEAEGVVQEIPYRNRKVEPVIKDRLVDGVFPQFSRPFPLNDKYFVVTGKLHRDGLWGVYLVDIYDNVTLLHETEDYGYITPIPVAKRPTPPVIPDRVDLSKKDATVFIQDLHVGEGLHNVPKGVVKKLRIFSYEYAYMKSPSDFDALGVQSGWDLKRELGTVDVEEDGSVLFTVPANTPISLQPLDEDGNAIQWMRSWFTAMPGEVVSCVGCHEDQNIIPIPKRTIAANKAPKSIIAPKGGVRPFSYELEVQPVLDKYCISCHNGENGMTDLSGREKTKYYRWGNYTSHRQMNNSYFTLHPYVYRQGPEADMYVLEPYEYHASNSELIQMITKGHHNVSLEKEDMQKLCQWIDFNAPYFGDFEIAGRYKGVFEQYPRRMQLMQRYANVSTDWKGELHRYAQFLKEQGPVAPVKPKAVSANKNKNTKADKWSFDAEKARQMQKTTSTQPERSIEVAPGMHMQLVWVPEGKYTRVQEGTGKTFDEHIKKGFWMGKMEVTNAQYQALVPEHDSRYIGQQWKDHTTPGYVANEPLQPVIRVTWQDAMKYCQTLSEKTGLKVTLPTEEQWEWACRAGSASDMWYGKDTVNYSKLENLADFTIKDLAVYGLEPTVPMPNNFFCREFWDFVPRDRFSDDASIISTTVGKYLPNAWGLHDMHGNVAEWTNSECTHLENHNGQKVVCGGSWRDRASKANANARRYFHPWQAAFNVGFRVVLSD